MRVDRADPRIAPRRHSAWRTALVAGIERVGARLGGRALYVRRHLAPGRVRWREERVEVGGLAPAFEGYRVVQLSDLHAGPWLGAGDLAQVVGGVNARRPDLIALTGDFLTRSVRDVEAILPELARLEAADLCLAVLGNHDYRGRREGELAAALAGAGVRVLRDELARVERGGASLAVVGLEDLEEARAVDLARALRGLGRQEPWIALCHHPLGARPLAAAGAALVLAGHTHGTQLDLPFLRRLGPPHPGARVRIGATTLLVSRGLGVTGVPWRCRAPAEVVVATLSGRTL